jgi:hypothetical protein
MRFILFLILTMIFIRVAAAQNSRDSINIKAMVQDQINSAKEVLQQEKILLERAKKEHASIRGARKINIRTIDSSSSLISAATYLKIYILTVASFLAFLIIAYRRSKKRTIKGESKKLKNNIKLLRKEVPVQNFDKDLSTVRKEIIVSDSDINSEENISSVAKKHSLAKGEILLAAKIKEKMFGHRKDSKRNRISINNYDDLTSDNIIEEADSILSNRIDQKEIVKKAKKLNVSREEVMLVSRLKKMISTNAA